MYFFFKFLLQYRRNKNALKNTECAPSSLNIMMSKISTYLMALRMLSVFYFNERTRPRVLLRRGVALAIGKSGLMCVSLEV